MPFVILNMVYRLVSSSIFFSLLVYSSNPMCLESTQGTAFLHHSYNTFITEDPLRCYHQCITEIACQSINYYRKSGKCELNSRTIDLAEAGDLQMNDEVIYIDNPSRVPIGSSKFVPAYSCQEIKKININFVSGLYWVTSVTGPKQDYCDVMRIAPSYCDTYTNISDVSRNTNYTSIDRKCDRSLPKKWYRFTGQAGARMPTSCIPTYRCGTDAPGWLTDPHPSFHQGIVTRKVCFHWKSNCCHWSTNIRVINCGEFYVYELVASCCCNLRYCVSSY